MMMAGRLEANAEEELFKVYQLSNFFLSINILLGLTSAWFHG